MWDINKIAEIVNKSFDSKTKWTYIITNDKEDFLNRMEGIAKRGLKQDGDNLKCLEILAAVQATRNGEDIFKAFPMLRG